MNKSADYYFIGGCGRCSLYETPSCKVVKWNGVLTYIRSIIIESELIEECKWGVPCYTYEGSNIALLSAFKDFCAVSFMKGALMNDPHNILETQGENSNEGRIIKISSIEEAELKGAYLLDYIEEAISVEKSGKKIKKIDTNALVFPKEFDEIMSADPELKVAFDNLTPGRKRGYHIFFSAPKQSKTIIGRIEKFRNHILHGKGFQER